MDTVIRALFVGLVFIGLFTIAACLFASAPFYVWLGISIVFVTGALFELLVLRCLRNPQP